MANDIVVNVVNLYPKGKTFTCSSTIPYVACWLLKALCINCEPAPLVNTDYNKRATLDIITFKSGTFLKSSDHSNIVSIVDLTSFHFKVK